MSRFAHSILVLCTVFLFTQSARGQLDSVHWIPPCHAAAEFGEHYLYLTTPHSEVIDVIIRLGNGDQVQDGNGNVLDVVSISNSSPQIVYLGTSVQAGLDVPILTGISELSQPISHKGLRLSSNKVFYVNYRARSGLQAASLTSKGENALGKDFRIGHIPGAFDANVPVGFRRSNFVSVMATEDSTEVIISEMPTSLAFETETGSIPTGGTVSFYLNEGESYVGSAYYGIGWPAENANGLMGARVQSDKPVVVNCGSWLGSPFNFNNQDIGIDQIVPSEYTGREYILVRGDGPFELETPIVVAYTDSTVVSINDGPAVTTLDRGEFYVIDESYYSVGENVYVHSNEPFYMYQSLAGADDRRTGGFNFIPPLGCSSEKSINNMMDIDLIGSTNFQGKLFIVSETGADVWINNNQMPAPFFNDVPGNPDYKTIKSPNLRGLVEVRSTGAIQVGLFGRNQAAGWAGYFSGFKRAIPPKLEINSQLSCDGTLYLDEMENVLSHEWYFNGVVIDSTSDTLYNLKPGEYYVIGYNSVCEAIRIDTTDAFTINPPLTYNISGGDVPCASAYSGWIKLDSIKGGYPPFRFSFDNGMSYSTLSYEDSLGAGTYNIVIEDSLGCLFTDSVVISDLGQLPLVSLDTPDSITCIRPQIDILSTGSSASPPWTYRWFDSQGTLVSDALSITVGVGGTYILELIDTLTGCAGRDSVLVFEDLQPPDLDVSGNDTIYCTRPSIVLFALFDPTESNILWRDLSGRLLSDSLTSTIRVDHPGSYLVTVTNNRNGCISDTVITVLADTVQPMIKIIEPDILTCAVTEVELVGDLDHFRAVDYTWTTKTGQILGNTSTAITSCNQPGEYKLYVEDPVNGCSDSSTIYVTQDTLKPDFEWDNYFLLTCRDPVFSSSPEYDCPTCQGRWHTLSGENIQDTLSDSQTFSSSGKYIYTLSNVRNGCLTKDTLTIEEAPRPQSFEVVADPGECDDPNGSLHVTSVNGGVPPYQFSLNGGPLTTSTDFEALPPGKYILELKDSNDCRLLHSSAFDIHKKIRIISINDIVANLGEIRQFLVNINLELGEIETIEWRPPDQLSCTDCLDPMVECIRSGIYTIVVKDIYGCEDSAVLTLFVRRDLAVFIPNAFTPTGDLINDGFTAFVKKGQARRITQFQIYDRWGELMFERQDIPPNDPSVGWDGTFLDKEAQPGVYTYLIEIEFVDDSRELYYGDVTMIR